MKRGLWLVPLVIAIVLGALVMPVGVASAATTQDVSINATPTYIAISNSPSSFDFGVIAASVTNQTTNTTGDHFSLTDTSSVNVTTTIVCQANWTGGTGWTWGAPGEDTAYLTVSDGDDAYDIAVPDAGQSAVTLHVSASIGEDWTWEMGLEGPTSFTFGDEQECTIRLTGTAT